MDLIDAERAGPASGAGVRVPRGRRLLALVLAVVALAGAAVLPLAPVRMSMPTVSWPQDPSRPASTMLQLTNQQPLALDVRFSCTAARAAAQAPGGVLVATLVPGQDVATEEGLLVTVRDGELSVVSRGRTLAAEPVPDGACGYRIRGDPTRLAIERDGTPRGAVAAVRETAVLPDVDVLATGIEQLPSDDDLRVRLGVDDQFDAVPAPAKQVLLAVVLAAAAGALVLLRREDRARPPDPPEPRVRPPRAAAVGSAVVDGVVVATLLLWLFLAPPTDDDGYYAAMARNAAAEGFVGNYYQLLNQSFTPFTWFYRLLGWWDQVGSSPVVLRVPALVVGLGTWLLLRRFVSRPGALPAAVGDSGRGRLAAVVLLGAAFLAWWLPYGMGVRPEAVVGFLALAALSGVAAGLHRQRLLPVALAVGAAALAVVCHPTGFVALAPLLAGLPRLVPLLRAGGTALATVTRTALVLAPAALAAAAAFADGTLNDFLRGQEIFLSVQGQDSWEDEHVRYGFLLSAAPMGNYAKRTAVLLALVALVWFLAAAVAARARAVRLPPPLVLAGSSLALAFLLLWITPSKWTHHFGALAGLGPAFLALFLVAVPWLARSAGAGRLPGAVPVAALGSAVVMCALAFQGPNSWPYTWLPGLPDPFQRPDVLGIPFGSLLTWAVAALAVLAGTALLRRRTGRPRPPSWPWAVPALVLLFLATSVTYLVGSFSLAAARTVDSYSPWADALTDPLAEDCGAARAVRVLDVDAARPLAPEQAGPAPAGGAFVGEGGWFPASPPPASPGEGVATEVWGSLPEPGREDLTGSLQTPWFPLPGTGAGAAPAVLASGRLDAGNELRVEYGVRAGGAEPRVVGAQPLADGVDSPTWRTFVLDPAGAGAPGAQVLRLVAEDRSGGPGGWLAVTGPSVLPEVSLAEYVPDGAPVAVNWQTAFLFPCQRQPVIRHGITEPVEYGVGWRSGPTGSGMDDNVWQDFRGGQFAPVARTSSVTVLATSIAGRPDVVNVQVYRFGLPYPTGGYALEVRRVQRMGWAGPPAG
ncbi:arabinosyltransferase domain-containing protein [Geodermatophilus ruber]|uniref:Arabinosyltransferase C n=1 Tax=Geodermatophilus ruber TaxID=504800 RepID=A0A1I4L8M6_9ACTN|nr:arabinosyltransferase domain-containing protein [Geodermatophilus ruber]SFL87143.1 arabinosyltransferase C [Geodermatophilus ruber]